MAGKDISTEEFRELMERLFPGWDVQVFNWQPVIIEDFARLFGPDPEIEPA